MTYEADFGDEAMADSMEDRARRIKNDLHELARDMHAKPEEVRPSVIDDVMTTLPYFINASEVGIGLYEIDESIMPFTALSGTMFGMILLQVVGRDTDSGLAKRFWLDVAEVLGPDHAQTMYRAAVFMTKVA